MQNSICVRPVQMNQNPLPYDRVDFTSSGKPLRTTIGLIGNIVHSFPCIFFIHLLLQLTTLRQHRRVDDESYNVMVMDLFPDGIET
mmetsp:Transcript_29203/g.70401  ORF Transcript_29203/g.70401 Transcript_29203/m.70401 type:complete len:86 (-) Transcript_29203:460-717(-)